MAGDSHSSGGGKRTTEGQMGLGCENISGLLYACTGIRRRRTDITRIVLTSLCIGDRTLTGPDTGVAGRVDSSTTGAGESGDGADSEGFLSTASGGGDDILSYKNFDDQNWKLKT